MLTRYTKKFAHYLRHNRAVSALEYALLVGIIATAIAVAITTFGTSVDTTMDSIGTALTNAGTPTVDLDGTP